MRYEDPEKDYMPNEEDIQMSDLDDVITQNYNIDEEEDIQINIDEDIEPDQEENIDETQEYESSDIIDTETEEEVDIDTVNEEYQDIEEIFQEEDDDNEEYSSDEDYQIDDVDNEDTDDLDLDLDEEDSINTMDDEEDIERESFELGMDNEEIPVDENITEEAELDMELDIEDIDLSMEESYSITQDDLLDFDNIMSDYEMTSESSDITDYSDMFDIEDEIENDLALEDTDVETELDTEQLYLDVDDNVNVLSSTFRPSQRYVAVYKAEDSKYYIGSLFISGYIVADPNQGSNYTTTLNNLTTNLQPIYPTIYKKNDSEYVIHLPEYNESFTINKEGQVQMIDYLPETDQINDAEFTEFLVDLIQSKQT